MYTPKDDDFDFLTDRDLSVDENFAAQGYWKGVAVHFVRNRLAVAGALIVCLVIVFAVLAPIVSPYSYDEIVSVQTLDSRQIIAKNLQPQIGTSVDNVAPENFADKTFVFGTDELGRDLWTRTWQGARVSLIIAFVAIFIDMVIGTSYGLVSGYFGGRVDNVMQRFIEIESSVPTLVIISILRCFGLNGLA